jgi:hypothetical protein
MNEVLMVDEEMKEVVEKDNMWIIKKPYLINNYPIFLLGSEKTYHN